MLFNSLQFFAFFLVVYVAYRLLEFRWQNRMLLVASCIFYASWDWRFLALLFTSISVDFVCASLIHRSAHPGRRKNLLILSVSANLLILGFFKYFNFFSVNLKNLLDRFGLHLPIEALNIVLPLGISFYTFEAISYVVDVHRRKIEPARRYSDYALFVTFFPHLIAGPIMRAKELMPQICSPRSLSAEQTYQGVYLFCWGLFQKVVVADRLAEMVNPVFAGNRPHTSPEVIVAIYAFAFQVLCDFEGYSNMARGLAKCLGFEIGLNFNLPYFSTSPKEFWQRWHISLSTWLRDYLYIPLGGRKQSLILTCRNLFITMVLGGLWHGASWTFIWWGAYHGFLLSVHRVILFLREKSAGIANPLRARSDISRFLKMFVFFHLVCFGWLLFRAESMRQVFEMMGALSHMLEPDNLKSFVGESAGLLAVVAPLLAFQTIQFLKNDQEFIFKTHWMVQGTFYFWLVASIMVYGSAGGNEFIYFQF